MTELTTTEELYARRYGAPFREEIAEPTAVIEQQLRHRSVRKYTGEQITDAQLHAIIAAAQSGATSSNLQAWSVIAVRDQARRDRLSAMLGGHHYIENCSVFLVWVADFARDRSVVESTSDLTVDTVGFIENTLVGFVDVGIAAQNALLAAESLGLGGVFVGGIRNNPAGVAEELGLPFETFPVVGMALGYPDPDEAADTKPRLPQRTVLHHEQYDADAWQEGTDEFEERLREYYARFGKDDYSWARTLKRRVGKPEGMYGRQNMAEWLHEQGFATK